jgi:RNA polymerase-binding transcription factor
MTTQRKSSGGTKAKRPALRSPAKPSPRRSAAPKRGTSARPIKAKPTAKPAPKPVVAKKPVKGPAKPVLAVKPVKPAKPIKPIKPVKPVKPPAVVRPLGVLPPEMVARPTHKAPAHVIAPERPAPRPRPSAAAAPAPGVTTQDYEEFAERLQDERRKILKEMGHLEHTVLKINQRDSAGDLSGYSFHMADVGTDAMEREKAFLFASAEGRQLLEINEALRRVYAGTYGVCEECERPIARARLEVMPYARLCLSCKEKEERTARGQT